MKPEVDTRFGKIAVATLILLLSVFGILVSYWYGLGWFFLFQTIREFFFAVPQLYLTLIRVIAGHKFADEDSLRLENSHLFTSGALARRVFLSVVLTILVFWKANIPLYRIIEMINR